MEPNDPAYTAIHKAFLNRPKDRADLEKMHKAGTLDARVVREILVDALGEDDESVRMLDRLVRTGRASRS